MPWDLILVDLGLSALVNWKNRNLKIMKLGEWRGPAALSYLRQEEIGDEVLFKHMMEEDME